MSRTTSSSGRGWIPWKQYDTTDNQEVLNDRDGREIEASMSGEPQREQEHIDEGQSGKGRQSLKVKPSVTSLGSVTTGGWLSWTSKVSSKENTNDTNKGNGNTKEEGEEEAEEEAEEEEGGMDIDDNGDEVDDHIGKESKRTFSSSWNFWGNSGNTNTGNGNSNDYNNNSSNVKVENEVAPPKADKEQEKEKDKGKVKEKEKKPSFSNTILNSTPSFPTKSDLLNSPKKDQKLDKNNDSDENSPPPQNDDASVDDAVLYKPHDNANQFNKINTHKNENLKENIIVPSWNVCLPHQSSATSSTSAFVSSALGSSTTANQTGSLSAKVDLKNWRQVLNQLSTRLGFSSQSLSNVTGGRESEGDTNDNETTEEDNGSYKLSEKETSLLYERTYKLYGKSLAKLPNYKRACLPNYNKYYTRSSRPNQVSDHEEDEENGDNGNSISVSNDPMGNLLINHKPYKNKRLKASLEFPDVVSKKAGPLQRIRKILIIGVHGFFPTKMIRPIIGSPKGTSLKFANEAEKAVIRYCLENNLFNERENNLSIQKIALEKEGKIFDRVDFFTEILKKWQKELNNADFIFIASHSQGCVVSIILLAKLIELGILQDPIKKRIGLLGMAGVNNGPFYGVDKSFFMKAYSTIEHDSMMELFELTKFSSPQSLAYKQSIQVAINANVKICFIGSINDQLVPLYSASASHVFHPNIYRACYIDHSSHTPLFIRKLVSLCCQLQNLGYFDNNVLKELSSSLAGPLTGGGHSKIYNDGKVYDLGIRFVLDTDDLVIPSEPLSSPDRQLVGQHGSSQYGLEGSSERAADILNIPITNQVYIKEFNISKIGSNPFIMPWCLRGLLFNIEKNWPNNNKLISVDKGEEFGKDGYDEINELYNSFDSWTPDSKLLKDLKFRLNGLRASKL